MDPLSALAIATSVVQFLDFTSKILIQGYASYNSEDGLSNADVALEAVVSDLEELSISLASSPAPGRQRLSQDEVSLGNLARKCWILADKLLQELDRLRIKNRNQGIWKSWATFCAAVKRVMTDGRIQKMKKELDDIRCQVVVHMLRIVKNSQSALMSEVNALAIKTQTMHIENSIRLDDMKQTLLAVLVDNKRERDIVHSFQEKLDSTRPKDTTRDVLNALHLDHDAAITTSQHALRAVLPQLQAFTQGISETDKILKILKSLEYAEMPIRHRDIHEAYGKSLHWVYSQDARLAEWLSQGSGLFWINGKAGSGKSTLMKYLVENEKTQELLSQWANEPVYIIKFYFWNSGYPMQKTQQGLLQSLLLQILRKCPQLIPECFSARWVVSADSLALPEAWSRTEMLRALEILLDKELTMSFCLFIDGLDEFEMSNTEGDHYDLVQSLARFERSRCFKLCVSSRPWKLFSKAYEVGLRVQDWNREDIDNYVRSLLGEDARFNRMAEGGRGQNLITQILDNAQGVFLWVWLVVRALLHGLSMDDDIATLQRRLDALPRDLETYFQHMLDKVEDVYSEHAACLLQLAVREQPLTALALSYIPKELAQPGTAFLTKIRLASDTTLNVIDTSAETALNQWCRDMLEIRGSRLEFLHRTVKDFLETPDVQQQLVLKTGPEFDAWWMLLQLYLFQAKTASRDIDHFHDLAGDVMAIARQYEIHGTNPVDKVIVELDRVGKHFETRSNPTKSWTACVDKDCTLMAMAVSFGLTRYVRHHLVRADPVLLDFALCSRLVHRRLPKSRAADLEMLQILFEKGGANPNGVVTRAQLMRTPWTRFLSTPGGTVDVRFAEIAMLLIEHDADLGAKILKGKKTVPVKRMNEVVRNIELDDFCSVEESLASHCSEHDRADIQQCIERKKARASQTMLGSLLAWFWSNPG